MGIIEGKGKARLGPLRAHRLKAFTDTFETFLAGGVPYEVVERRRLKLLATQKHLTRRMRKTIEAFQEAAPKITVPASTGILVGSHVHIRSRIADNANTRMRVCTRREYQQPTPR